MGRTINYDHEGNIIGIDGEILDDMEVLKASRTKIKIFSMVDPERLESVINDFIADKAVIDIKYQSFPDGKLIRDRVLIVYEER